jgi:hypothetical protein
MVTSIPSAAEVRLRLEKLPHAELKGLACASAVPFTTLWKIRSGETRNPGIETVRQFLPLLTPADTTKEPSHAA